MLIDGIKLREKIQQLIDTRSQITSAGSVKDFEEYKAITGQISGLTSAIFEINDLLERQRKADGNE